MVKQINQKTKGGLLAAYPQIPLQENMGLRNILAHVSFEVDEQQIYDIWRDDIPQLISTVRQMIQDLDG
ncbi:HepT-like ribonuclease domain-containing protein [Phormidium tenue]|uniref:HepT-like ribonuclease domain-containing protein n=1 Tax=Phormidium tenue TaxID=126344 RepID=UPI000A022E2F